MIGNKCSCDNFQAIRYNFITRNCRNSCVPRLQIIHPSFSVHTKTKCGTKFPISLNNHLSTQNKNTENNHFPKIERATQKVDKVGATHNVVIHVIHLNIYFEQSEQ